MCSLFSDCLELGERCEEPKLHILTVQTLVWGHHDNLDLRGSLILLIQVLL